MVNNCKKFDFADLSEQVGKLTDHKSNMDNYWEFAESEVIRLQHELLPRKSRRKSEVIDQTNKQELIENASSNETIGPPVILKSPPLDAKPLEAVKSPPENIIAQSSESVTSVENILSSETMTTTEIVVSPQLPQDIRTSCTLNISTNSVESLSPLTNVENSNTSS